MSAFVVDPHHINSLVSWAAARGTGSNGVRYYWGRQWRDIAPDAKRVASVLRAENVRSVNTRYSEAEPAHGFKFKRVDTDHLSGADVVCACDCLDYQSCETDDWKDTEAYAALQAIREAAVRDLVGGCSTWELTSPTPVRRTV